MDNVSGVLNMAGVNSRLVAITDTEIISVSRRFMAIVLTPTIGVICGNSRRSVSFVAIVLTPTMGVNSFYICVQCVALRVFSVGF